jgi:hypothetical protein
MSTVGHSGTPLPKKLGIIDDSVFHVRHAPTGFVDLLGDTGTAVCQQSLLAPLDIVIAFHSRRTALLAEWPKLTAAAQPDGVVWVAWPKKNPTGSTVVATDLTEDALRAHLLKTGWVDNKICSIDDNWSALRFVLKAKRLRPKDNARRKR